MANFKTLEVHGFQSAIAGMRNPYKSYPRADSELVPIENHPGYFNFVFGDNDYTLAKNLRNAGPEHCKWMRMVTVWVDITAPRYWWSEFDTYKIGTTANSESTMHKLKDEDFYAEATFDFPYGLDQDADVAFEEYLFAISSIQARLKVIEKKDPLYNKYHRLLKAMLPESFMQKRTICLNYQVLANMYHQRKNHKLPEWNKDFVEWINSLPYAEFITGEFDK